MAFQFRRGTDAERQSITPKAGEPIFVTDTGKLYVGYTDPETNSLVQGGLLVSTTLSDDETPSLSGNLNLNDYDIVGTGNINIDGFITATGSINLGDGVEDNIIVGGVIGSSLIPDTDGLYDLGSSDFYWRKGYFKDVEVDGELKANSLQISSIELNDSTTIFDGDTNTIFAESIVANNIEGNFVGSVFSDDSRLLIDGAEGSLNTNFIKIVEERIENQISDEPIRIFSNNGIRIFGKATPDIFDSNLLVLNGVKEGGDVVSIGDITGALVYAADDGINFSSTNAILSEIDDTASVGNIPGKLKVLTTGVDGEIFESMVIDSRGTVSSNVFKTGSYADEDTRDADIPNPEAGMIILLTGRNDSTGVPKFQGYDGSNWIDFY